MLDIRVGEGRESGDRGPRRDQVQPEHIGECVGPGRSQQRRRRGLALQAWGEHGDQGRGERLHRPAPILRAGRRQARRGQDYEPEFMAACLTINEKFQAMNSR